MSGRGLSGLLGGRLGHANTCAIVHCLGVNWFVYGGETLPRGSL